MISVAEDAGAAVSVTPSRGTSLLPAVALTIDVVVLTVAMIAAYIGRNTPFFGALRQQHLPEITPIIGISWLILLWGYDLYSRETFEPASDELRRLCEASFISGGLVVVGNYLAHHQLSRAFFMLAYGIGLVGLVLGRLALRTFLHASRSRGHFMKRVVIAGGSDQVDEVAAVFRRESWVGYEVLGALTPTGVGATRGGVRSLGRIDDLVSAVVTSGTDILCIAGGAGVSATALREVMWQLEPYGVQIAVAPTMTDIAADRVRMRPIGGLPLVLMDPARWADSSSGAKRAFDVVVTSLILFAMSPVLAVAAWRIRRFDGGPIMYRQRRIGLGGQPFDCLKFRTMVVGAETMKAALEAEHGSDGMLFKLKDDPRVTKPGAWLRKYSIDELPQLFNVLRGDMSLVGPRPQVDAEVAMYDNGMARRLNVRPGMTGLWQVSGRSDLSYEDARRLDIYYVDNWSLGQDLSILRRTVRAVFAGHGAY
ncbi:polyprenyl glycosylphosphotransferase [Nocardioides baekrokdamisoli]|uniref:Polyprenyl glycosylphosphotransferase n=1 Tax=Nocardioides baekrokdamisoli TaxID=1804624 RepID=A0A3G9J290_9ACTN|nr:sugar transferase [Nocardioides baekrokdamisoli]BBH17109.1 polyprenyl glycosylphosphotransferase [Nocardioides baekrokdamisoli]